MHVQVWHHFVGTDSPHYRGAELMSTALLTGTLYLLSHLTRPCY